MSKQPPPALYALHAGAPCRADGARIYMSMGDVRLPPGFATDRIALYLSGGRQLEYYAGAAWPETLDAVLRDFISGAARHSCSGIAIDDDMPGAAHLLVRVNDFAPVYAAGPDTVPRLKVSLTLTAVSADGKVMADFTVARERAAAANSLTAVTGGLEGLLRAALEDGFRRLTAQAGR
jgi:hypothetical protein